MCCCCVLWLQLISVSPICSSTPLSYSSSWAFTCHLFHSLPPPQKNTFNSHRIVKVSSRDSQGFVIIRTPIIFSHVTVSFHYARTDSFSPFYFYLEAILDLIPTSGMSVTTSTNRSCCGQAAVAKSCKTSDPKVDRLCSMFTCF